MEGKLSKIVWGDYEKGVEARKKLRKALRCSDAVVSYALNFKRPNETSRKIQNMALNDLGGKLLKETKKKQADD